MKNAGIISALFILILTISIPSLCRAYQSDVVEGYSKSDGSRVPQHFQGDPQFAQDDAMHQQQMMESHGRRQY